MAEPTFKAKATFDFNPQGASEMGLTANEQYTIHEVNGSGWYRATAPDGTHGWVPSNYMKKIYEQPPSQTPPETVSAPANPVKVFFFFWCCYLLYFLLL